MFSANTNQQLDTEWQDFINGNQIEFEPIDCVNAEKLTSILSQSSPYEKLFEFFNQDVDRLAIAACCAFKEGNISRLQVGTLLELRTIKKNPNFSLTITPLLDNNGQYTETSKMLLGYFNFSKKDRETLLALLKNKPASERYFFTLTITGDDLDNIALQMLLRLSDKEIIREGQIKSIQRNNYQGKEEIITIFTLGAEEAMTEVKYGNNAKKLFPALGSFSVNKIDESMRRRGRYLGLSYPGIQDVTSFHDVEANMFYLSLHDRYHRRLISSIPNVLYDAFFHAIDVIRQATKLKWSHEIWLCTDMEIGLFLQQKDQERFKNYTEVDINADFLKLLAARVFTTDEQLGLFTASPYIETTWLLLIDMVLKPDEWKKLSIDPLLFRYNSIYKQLYDFAAKYKESLRELSSPAHQVAFIKAQYFHSDYDKKIQYSFLYPKGKKPSGSPRYIQLMVDGKPMTDKQKVFEVMNADSKAMANEDMGQILLSFDELMALSTEKLQLMTSNTKVFKLINQEILTVNQLKKLSVSAIDLIAGDMDIVILIRNNKLNVDDPKHEALMGNFYNRRITGRHIALIIEKRINLVELKELTPELAEQMINHPFYHLMMDGKLNINQMKKLYPDYAGIVYHLYLLIEHNKLTIDELLELHEDIVQDLLSGLDQLVQEGYLTIEEMPTLTPELKEDLKNREIQYFIKHNILTVKEIEELALIPGMINGMKQSKIGFLIRNDLLTVEALKGFASTPGRIDDLNHFNIYFLITNKILTVKQFLTLPDGAIDKIKEIPVLEFRCLVEEIKEKTKGKQLTIEDILKEVKEIRDEFHLTRCPSSHFRPQGNIKEIEAHLGSNGFTLNNK